MQEAFDDEHLPILSKEEIDNGYKEIRKTLFIPKSKLTEILSSLIGGNHVLLAGPIGTGKTQLAKLIPKLFWKNFGGYYAEDFTATSDWNTQDVIGGIYPKMEGKQVVYDIQYGCVTETVSKNWERNLDGGSRIHLEYPDQDRPYRGVWLVIDEFNRADIDKAFGQLFTSLRTRTLKVPTNQIGKSHRSLTIPKDFRIIGTLNTADKHFLFQLSDALKSRFSYILIDIPSRSDLMTEIYYGVKNAISSLSLSKYDDMLLVDNDKMSVSKSETNPDFYNLVLMAYNYLDSIRIFKKLGTGILQLVFQNMIVGSRMSGNDQESLDNSLTAILIPQMENLSLATLGALEALYNNTLVQYFKDSYKSPNRQSFSDVFEKVLKYLDIANYKDLSEQFSNGTLKTEDKNTWTTIEIKADEVGQKFSPNLFQFNSALDDLKSSAVI